MKEIVKSYMTLKEACAYTGLSVFYLRNGCKAGTVPHITSGNRYFVNVPALLEKLKRESVGNGEKATR